MEEVSLIYSELKANLSYRDFVSEQKTVVPPAHGPD